MRGEARVDGQLDYVMKQGFGDYTCHSKGASCCPASSHAKASSNRKTTCKLSKSHRPGLGLPNSQARALSPSEDSPQITRKQMILHESTFGSISYIQLILLTGWQILK